MTLDQVIKGTTTTLKMERCHISSKHYLGEEAVQIALQIFVIGEIQVICARICEFAKVCQEACLEFVAVVVFTVQTLFGSHYLLKAGECDFPLFTHVPADLQSGCEWPAKTKQTKGILAGAQGQENQVVILLKN